MLDFIVFLNIILIIILYTIKNLEAKKTLKIMVIGVSIFGFIILIGNTLQIKNSANQAMNLISGSQLNVALNGDVSSLISLGSTGQYLDDQSTSSIIGMWALEGTALFVTMLMGIFKKINPNKLTQLNDLKINTQPIEINYIKKELQPINYKKNFIYVLIELVVFVICYGVVLLYHQTILIVAIIWIISGLILALHICTILLKLLYKKINETPYKF